MRPEGRLVRLHRSLTPTTRRVLRGAQLLVAVLTTVAIVDVVAAQPAAADNCSVFTDCFGVANSAIEAAFGLSLLAVLSMVLDFVPVVGTVKGVVEAITGRDLLTGQELAAWERALGVLPLLGGLGALGALSRMGRNVPTVRPPHGTRYTLPSNTPQLSAYRAQNVTPAQRARLSEELGEIGGMSYVRDVAGNPNVSILRPTSSADVADLVRRFEDGVPWDDAVAFGGRNATNLVYFDGKTLHIIEAKGGSGRYIDRESVSVLPNGGRISQTDPQYPRDVAADMSSSSRTDGRNEIGDLIEDAYAADQVRYVGVRTGPYDQLVNGTPDTVVENVFREPRP
ncbi:pre-toxin TG domain-containing protein [Actinotalea ferrariae]|uniref:pre-toxin TG domain-containing protein n=1 Tax=Actinotalea ferrariae TaxID=1386098 RepID=UPI001C8B2B8F|nr:pre-toxin TG domain-containing protein [Actinotalea ferrariae]MBX9246484.1 pre-toxin TG domain-containing protein [Actinotalea ferrariae]